MALLAEGPMLRRRGFESTQWSVVLAAAGDRTGASREALEALCERYWYPVYAFVRRRGHAADEAEDLTQAFFAKLIEKHYVRDADPARGKFRAFLLTAVTHFLANERDREAALKRGGGRMIVSLDGEAAEGRFRAEPADPLTPERVFERRWALTTLERALARLRAEHERAGAADRFERLKGCLTGEAASHGELAAALGMTEGAVKVAVHRLRRRYRELLRAEIAETLVDPATVDDELRELLAALA
jgi:RNA polymerase sigma factor (sigma-70 family)